jgi:hypothetical protein
MDPFACAPGLRLGRLRYWFDFGKNECRIKPDVLLSLTCKYYPRDQDGSVDYPPPVVPDTPENDPYKYPSPQGPPGQLADWCPYIYIGTVYNGTDADMYRYPHIAHATL